MGGACSTYEITSKIIADGGMTCSKCVDLMFFFNMYQWRALVNRVMKIRVPSNAGNLLIVETTVGF